MTESNLPAEHKNTQQLSQKAGYDKYSGVTYNIRPGFEDNDDFRPDGCDIELSSTGYGVNAGSSKATDVAEIEPFVKVPVPSIFTHYFTGFWLMTVSFYFMFTCYNTLQSLASTVHGAIGATSIAVLYIFFIPGNFVAPAITKLYLGNNPAVAMLIGSIGYTLFAGMNIIGGYAALVSGGAIVGMVGGLLWVGQAVYLGRSARLAAKNWVEDGLAGRITFAGDKVSVFSGFNQFPSPRHWTPSVLDQMTNKLVGRLIGTFLAVLMSTNVVGAIISWGILSKGWTEHSAPLDLSSVRLMFLVLMVISAVGGLSLFLLVKKNALLHDTPPRIDIEYWEQYQSEASQKAGLSDANSISATEELAQINHISSHFFNDAQVDTPIDIGASSAADSQSRFHEISLRAENPISEPQESASTIMLASIKSIFALITTEVTIHSLVVIFFGGLPMAFAQTAFFSVAASHLIGKASVPGAIVVLGLCDMVCAVIMARVLSNLVRTRIAMLASKVLILAALFTLLFSPYDTWTVNSSATWFGVLLIAGLLGAGDGILNPALTSTVGMQYEPKFTSAAFSVLSAVKGIAQCMMFVLSMTVGYEVMIWTVLFFAFFSIGMEVILIYVVPNSHTAINVTTQEPYKDSDDDPLNDSTIIVSQQATSAPHGNSSQKAVHATMDITGDYEQGDRNIGYGQKRNGHYYNDNI